MELKNYSQITTKIVAFDFFDTVVHRTCHPEQILYQWSKRMADEMRFIISPSNLYNLRKNIEKTNKESGIEELSYNNLLLQIFETIKSLQNFMTQDEFITKAKKLELEIELQHVYLDSNIKKILQMLKEKSKKIILISDFYADRRLIEEIMEKLGVLHYFSEIYISSEKSCRKSTGNLYRLIFKELELSPEEITMIGDNYQSDYEVPIALGMSSLYQKYTDSHTITDEKDLFQQYNEILFKNGEKEPFNGFLSDIVFFISKLHKKLVERNAQIVLFCSREGQLLKKLFDIYQTTFFYDSKKINTKYFYVSRRSTLYPSFDSLENEEFEIIFRQYKRISVSNFLLNLNFSDEEINSICYDLNLDLTHTLIKNSQTIKELKQHPIFITRFNIEKNEGLLFQDYINSLAANRDEIHIVDIGWKGTIQDNIQKALPTKKIIGYYLGLILKKYPMQNKENKFGLLFSDYPDQSAFFDIISRNFEYYEDIFVANHGPAVKYKREKEIIPVLDEDEKHIQVYKAVQGYQKQMIEGYTKLLESYKSSKWLPFEQENLWVRMSLKKECIHIPKLFILSLYIKEKVSENFGEIVTTKLPRKSRKWLFLEKKNFLWVDFTYKPFNGHNFLFIPSLYCKIVYMIKYIDLSLRIRKKYEK